MAKLINNDPHSALAFWAGVQKEAQQEELQGYAFHTKFEPFKQKVNEYVQGMKAIPEKIFYKPLILAAGSTLDSDQKVKFLLNNYISNVNLDMQMPEGSMTLLGWAITNKKSELVKLLLDKGADPNAFALKHNKTGVSYTAVGLVFYELLIQVAGSTVDSDKKVKFLLNNFISNVNLDMQTPEGSMTLLGWAITNKKSELVKLLLDKGADPNAFALKHNKTGVSYTAVGLVFNDYYQYYGLPYWLMPILQYFGVISAPKIDENILKLLVEYRAEVSEVAIACGDKAALIPSQHPLISRLPCVKEALAIESSKKVSDSKKTSEGQEFRIETLDDDYQSGWFSKVLSFFGLKSFWPSKSGDTQNANTASAGVVETKNEVPEGAAEGRALLPSNSDATEAPTTTQSSWYSGVFKFFGNIGNKVLSFVGLSSKVKHNGQGENNDDNVFHAPEAKRDLTHLKLTLDDGSTPLGHALKSNNLETAKTLLEQGANPNEIALYNAESHIAYTAMGVILEQAYEYHATCTFVVTMLQQNYNLIPTQNFDTPEINKDLFNLLVEYGAKLDQAVITYCGEGGEVPFIPSQDHDFMKQFLAFHSKKQEESQIEGFNIASARLDFPENIVTNFIQGYNDEKNLLGESEGFYNA
jgi:ankyrin repeat protein